jgi:hypothetical protein
MLVIQVPLDVETHVRRGVENSAEIRLGYPEGEIGNSGANLIKAKTRKSFELTCHHQNETTAFTKSS